MNIFQCNHAPTSASLQGLGAHGGASQTQPLQSRRITSNPVPHEQPSPGAPTTASRTRSRYGTTSELTQSTNTETGAPLTVLATQRHAPSLDEILAAETQQERLSRVVAAMAASQPPELFAGRFLLTPEQRGGGQATVHFARSGTGGFFQYAVKCGAALEQRECAACSAPRMARTCSGTSRCWRHAWRVGQSVRLHLRVPAIQQPQP